MTNFKHKSFRFHLSNTSTIEEDLNLFLKGKKVERVASDFNGDKKLYVDIIASDLQDGDTQSKAAVFFNEVDEELLKYVNFDDLINVSRKGISFKILFYTQTKSQVKAQRLAQEKAEDEKKQLELAAEEKKLTEELMIQESKAKSIKEKIADVLQRKR